MNTKTRVTIRNFLCFLLVGFAYPNSADLDQSSKLKRATHELITSLTDEQRPKTLLPLTDDRRATWSNLPVLMAPPTGIMLKDLSDQQRHLVHRMLRSSLSSQGYGKSAAIMWIDDILFEIEQDNLQSNPQERANKTRVAIAQNRSSGNYALAIFGNPNKDKWGWKITGHPLAVNITVAGGKIEFVPMFIGSNPRHVNSGRHAGWMALPHEGSLGIDLILSLDPEQRKKSMLEVTPNDVIAGPGRRYDIKKFQGLKSALLRSNQAQKLRQLVLEYLRNAQVTAAERQLRLIEESGWDSLWFSWAGDPGEGGQFYYRVHGERLLIEYNRQNENHDHAILRDPLNDYGELWLQHHYEEFHPSMENVFQDLQKRISPES